ncbi:Ni/Fe hydrogenase subunit alpha [bacterium]|nr:Ni/Fe hydrogenase subunit alpha [bacterium]
MADTRKIMIDPLTRVEGHASISILFDAEDRVQDARLHVAEYRGFEQFCRGHLIWEMPRLTSRICGVCPVSHAVTSARAGDEILAVAVPPAAVTLRRILILAQWVQSHTLSFFHFSAPDLLLGMQAPAESRSMFAMLGEHGELMRRGIRLRKWAQEVISRITGKRIHADYVIPGGVRSGIDARDREIILDGLPEAFTTVRQALDLVKSWLDAHMADLNAFAGSPTLFLAMGGEDGELEYYDGDLHMVGSDGTPLEHAAHSAYDSLIAEETEEWSYMSFPHYRALGAEKGVYRVGPLARLNICAHTGSPKSDAELKSFRSIAGDGKTVQHNAYMHYARLIEVLFALERIEELLGEVGAMDSGQLRARAFSNSRRGIGCTEAPRGTLFHDYRVDDDGIVNGVNLLIATAQNNSAMNRTIRDIARSIVPNSGTEMSEGMLNTIEAGIRAFDPCFSCATHALGQMPLNVTYRDSNGDVLRRFTR